MVRSDERNQVKVYEICDWEKTGRKTKAEFKDVDVQRRVNCEYGEC